MASERKEVIYKPTTTDALKPEMERKSPNYFLYFAAATSSLITFLSGISYSWTSPVLPKLNGNVDAENNPLGRNVTSVEESWIVGILNIGSIFGVVISGYMADRIGRKRTILALALPMAISLLILAFAKSIPLFYCARFLKGLGAGSGFIIVPVYLTEIAEDHNRGTLGCLSSVFVGSGMVFSYVIGPYLSISNFCLACVVPLIVFFPIFLIWAPETPVYLASVGDEKSLEKSLLKLRNKSESEVLKEATDMIKGAQASNQEKGAIKDLFKTKPSRRGLVITVSLITFQQFAGINAVLSYMQTIFNATGSGLAPEVSSIIVSVVQVFIIALSSSIVDRLGRRILLIGSSVGAGVSLVLLGLYFHLKQTGVDVSALSWLPVSSLVIFIVTYNMGFANLPWVVMAEMFPPNLKAVGCIFTGVVCFVDCFLITFFFPSLSAALGMAMSFWIFAIFCAIATVFLYTMLPETKGRSVEEIQMLLEGRRK